MGAEPSRTMSSSLYRRNGNRLLMNEDWRREAKDMDGRVIKMSWVSEASGEKKENLLQKNDANDHSTHNVEYAHRIRVQFECAQNPTQDEKTHTSRFHGVDTIKTTHFPSPFFHHETHTNNGDNDHFPLIVFSSASFV